MIPDNIKREASNDIKREASNDIKREASNDIKREASNDVIYVSPDGTTVTQRELDALDQLAAGYCARNNINIFN